MAQSELAAEDVQLLGRPKPQFTYSGKSGLKRKKRLSPGVDLSDNEPDLEEVCSEKTYSHLCFMKLLLFVQIKYAF